MSLPLSALLEQLSDLNLTPHNCGGDPCFASVQTFPGWAYPLRDDVIYLLTAESDLTPVPASGMSAGVSPCFLLPAAYVSKPNDAAASLRFIVIPNAERSNETRDRLCALFAAQEAWETALTDALDRGLGFQGLIDTAFSKCALPVLLWDAKLRLRAMTKTTCAAAIDGCFSVCGRLRGASLRVCVENALTGLRVDRFDVTSDDAADRRSLRVAPVHSEDGPVLFVAVLAPEGKIPAPDTYRLTVFAQRLGAYFVAHSVPDPVLRADALHPAALLPPELHVEEFLQPFRQEDGYFYFFVIASEEYFPLKTRMLMDSLRCAFTDDPIFMLDEHICFLRSNVNLRGSEQARRFDNLLASERACCGVSKRMNSPRFCRTAYEQACLALRLGRADLHPPYPDSRVFHYGAYAEMHSLCIYSQHMGDLLPLLPAKLGGFYRDSLRDDSNLRLLSVFLDCGMSSSAAARAMNIHRNTVIYRLNRMKEEYGIEMNNAECLHDVTRMLAIADYYRRYGRANPLD